MRNIGLTLIFLLALVLRVWQLDKLPGGFYEEEVTNAYVGRFILANGRDLYGNRWPLLYFDKFGDYPPVIPMYLAGFSTYIFGLTEFAARFPTALIGALSIFPLFFLAELLFKDKRVGLVAALLLAISPWHVVLSRTSAEGIVGFTVYLWGLFFLLKNNHWSFFLFFISYFLYPGLRLIIPMTLLPFYRKFPKATIFFVLLTIVIALTPWGKGRFLQTSLFHSGEIKARISSNMTALSYGEGQNNIRLARTFHNKFVGYTREFVDQYLSYFSPRHLFIEAGGQPRYFNVPFQGLLFITIGALIIVSIFGKVPAYVIYLLLITPLPAVLTIDFVPHAHRSMFMMLPILLLAALGFSKLTKFLPVFPVLLVLLVEFTYFWHQYSRHEAAYQSVLRNGGDKELAKYLVAHRGEYDKIILPPFERLPIYYLYFAKNFNPELVGHFKSQLQLDRVDNLEFFADWCPTKYLTREEVVKDTLIVENGDCGGNPGFQTSEIFYRQDSTKAYRLLRPE